MQIFHGTFFLRQEALRGITFNDRKNGEYVNAIADRTVRTVEFQRSNGK